jgi:hypothetical protein
MSLELFDVIGSDIREEDDPQAGEERLDLLQPLLLPVRAGRLRGPGPVQVLFGKIGELDVPAAVLGQQLVLDLFIFIESLELVPCL